MGIIWSWAFGEAGGAWSGSSDLYLKYEAS